MLQRENKPKVFASPPDISTSISCALFGVTEISLLPVAARAAAYKRTKTMSDLMFVTGQKPDATDFAIQTRLLLPLMSSVRSAYTQFLDRYRPKNKPALATFA